MIFVDTSAWYAAFVASDVRHHEVRSLLDTTAEELVTTDYCVDETLTLLAARRRSHLAVQAGHAFMGGELALVHFVGDDDFRRAWLLFEKVLANGLSFTDCTSKVVIDRLQIRTVIALDNHFRTFGTLIVLP